MEKNLFALKFMMFETNSHSDMYTRPYEVHTDATTLNMLAESTNDGTDVSSNALAGVASQILRPKAIVDSNVAIVNGFAQKRYAFMLDLAVQSNIDGNRVRHVISGYTDRNESIQSSRNSMEVFIPDDLVFFVNNIVTIREVTVPNGSGGYMVRGEIADSNQVIHTSSIGDSFTMHEAFNSPKWLMRPQDLAMHLEHSTNPMYSGFINDGASTRGNMLPVGQAKTNDRLNNTSANWMSRVFSGYKRGRAEANSFVDSSNVYSTMRSSVRDRTLTVNPFFHRLYNLGENAGNGSFDYATLKRIVPNADNELMLFTTEQSLNTMAMNQGMYDMQGQSNWGASTNEAVAATVIQQAVPSLMTFALLSNIYLVARNSFDGSGGYRVDVVTADTLVDNLSAPDLVNYRLIPKLEREVLDLISNYNTIPFMLTLSIDLMGESSIRISLDGGYEELFVIPTWCDSLLAPVVTANASALDDLSADMSCLMEAVHTFSVPQEYVQSSPIIANTRPGYENIDPFGVVSGPTGLIDHRGNPLI